MFQRADDRKSHLILNLLSWVNFLQPRFCLFENVRGFLSYNLNATQAGRYRVEGGIKMGGLKFLVHSLLAMKYVYNPLVKLVLMVFQSAIKCVLHFCKRLIMEHHNPESAFS